MESKIRWSTALIGLLLLAAGGAVLSPPLLTRPGPVNGRTNAPSAAGCDLASLTRFTPIVEWHADRYPELEIEDLYKLLHQAVAGPGHAIEDSVAALEWLQREWNDLGSSRREELGIEPLTEDGTLVRVNLRPWRDADRDPEEVLRAFLRTADVFHRDPARIRRDLDSFAACRDRIAGPAGISASLIGSFFAARAAEGYPAIDHSPAYRRTYDPAYRVVLRAYLD
jgi:hypothetical protein